MNCFIVDADQVSRTMIMSLASQFEELYVAGDCAKAMDAFKMMRSKRIDVLFVNVELPEMNGIELVRLLGDKSPEVVFFTSRKDYAADAFELDVADCIVMPISPVRFMQAIGKVKRMIGSRKAADAPPEQKFFFMRDSGMLKRLLIEDILFIEAMGDYVKIYTQQRFHAIHITLRDIEEKLPAEKFLRVHRSYIVALNKIDRVEEGVIVINNKPVPVADTLRNRLNKHLNIL